ncbi:MAG TPA: hypothetical protein VF602_13185 [Pedobacter sp.]
MLLDTLGHPCVLSLQNELHVPSVAYLIKDAIETKTKWVVVPGKGRKNEPVSIILVFYFSEDRMYYRHMAFSKNLPVLVELEESQRGKFTKY